MKFINKTLGQAPHPQPPLLIRRGGIPSTREGERINVINSGFNGIFIDYFAQRRKFINTKYIERYALYSYFAGLITICQIRL